jgi:hypothetical protein
MGTPVRAGQLLEFFVKALKAEIEIQRARILQEQGADLIDSRLRLYLNVN